MKQNVLSSLQEQLGTMDLSSALNGILEHEKKHRGIDWVAFYAGEGKEHAPVTRALRSLGLKGSAEALQRDPAAFLAAQSNADDGKTIANIHLCNSPEEGQVIDYLQGLSGDEMYRYVTYLTQKLQIAEQHTNATMIAVEIGGAGIVAIGGLWLKGTIVALRAGETFLAACAAGVSSLGITAAITAINVVIILVLIPFLIFMDKKAEMLALILNRTPFNVNMSYHFNHGKLVAEPKEMIPLTHNWVSIEKRTKWGDTEICAAGLMFVSKRDYALIGVEGACKLEFENGSALFPNGVYIGFSVPLASGDNSGYISWDAYSGAKDFLNKNYGKFCLTHKQEDSTRLIQSRVNRPDGGEPIMVAVVQDKR